LKVKWAKRSTVNAHVEDETDAFYVNIFAHVTYGMPKKILFNIIMAS